MEANTRSAVDGELLSLKALVENKSTKTSDLVSMGFEERSAPPPKAHVTPPESIDIKLPSKVRGQFTASARETGKIRWRCAAEWSPDPMAESTWAALPGYGKTRKGTSPSSARGLGAVRSGARAGPERVEHAGADDDPPTRRGPIAVTVR